MQINNKELPYTGSKAGNRNCPWEGSNVKISKDFKAAILNMFK